MSLNNLNYKYFKLFSLIFYFFQFFSCKERHIDRIFEVSVNQYNASQKCDSQNPPKTLNFPPPKRSSEKNVTSS